MNGIFLLCFILAIPAFAALGHDIYLTYQDQDFTKTMMFSDVGYLWTTYSPESYAWAKDHIDPGTWEVFLTPFLEQTTVLIALIPAILTFIIAMLLKIFNLPPFAQSAKAGKGPKGKNFSFGSGDRNQGQFKYKRK